MKGAISINKVPPFVLSRAYWRISEYLSDISSWPEDDWITITGNWDLNLYTYKASPTKMVIWAGLYRVKDGSTDTRKWCTLIRKDK